MSFTPADARAELPALLDAAHAAALEFLDGLAERPAGTRPVPPPQLDLPSHGLGGSAALACFRSRYEAGLSGSAGPRYLGFVIGGTTPAALAADWLVSAYDQSLATDGDSLASTVEREAARFLMQLFGLPDGFEGIFVTGATQANVVGLATARQWVGARRGVDVAEQGVAALGSVPVLGGSPHSSISKALAILGMGRRSITVIDRQPGRQAVDVAAMERALIRLGGAPSIVVASAGEVNTGDFDDIARLANLAERHGAWLHVDGAFGLFAACDPARAHLLHGLERADSVAVDAHKWLNVPYDAGVAFTRHVELQQAAFMSVAAYLGVGPDLMHRAPESSRRFRALPAWMTLMAYGREGYAELVRRCCDHAEALGRRIAASSRYELLAPVRLNVVCFALRDGSPARHAELMARLLDDGRVRVTPTTLDGRSGLRAAFSNWATEPGDLDIIWAALATQADTVQAG